MLPFEWYKQTKLKVPTIVQLCFLAVTQVGGCQSQKQNSVTSHWNCHKVAASHVFFNVSITCSKFVIVLVLLLSGQCRLNEPDLNFVFTTPLTAPLPCTCTETVTQTHRCRRTWLAATAKESDVYGWLFYSSPTPPLDCWCSQDNRVLTASRDGEDFSSHQSPGDLLWLVLVGFSFVA